MDKYALFKCIINNICDLYSGIKYFLLLIVFLLMVNNYFRCINGAEIMTI